MATAQQKLKIKESFDLIQGNQSIKVSEGLKELEKFAEESVLEILVGIAADTDNEDTKKQILAFLSQVVDPASRDLFIRYIKEEEFNMLRQALLSVVWNSRLDYSDYLADFVEIAVEGNFMEALECLTILENLEGPFEEHHLLEAQLHLREYAQSDRAHEEDRKTNIVSEIAMFIQEQNDGIDADLMLD